MIDIDTLRNNLKSLKELVVELGDSINPKKLESDLKDLEKKQEEIPASFFHQFIL